MPSDDVQTEAPQGLQGILTDNFFYFFLKLRKNRVQKVVAAINERFPELVQTHVYRTNHHLHGSVDPEAAGDDLAASRAMGLS